jgi:sporulation protein YlmC with PRC-barrel domain
MISLIYLYVVVSEDRRITMRDIVIRGKKVMNIDGSYLGILKNSIIDENTGGISGLIVQPSEEIDKELFQLDKNGNLVIAFNSLTVRDNNIILRN